MTAFEARLVLEAVEQLGEGELAAVGDEREHASGSGLPEDLVLTQRPAQLHPGPLLAAVPGVRTGTTGALLPVGADRDGFQRDLEEGRAAGLLEDGANGLLGLLGGTDAGLGAVHALGELVQPLAGSGDALLPAVGLTSSLGRAEHPGHAIALG